MFRYLAFAWNPSVGAQSEAAQVLTHRLQSLSGDWQAALDVRGLRVFCADVRKGSSEPYALSGQAGVVLGVLFERCRDPESSNVPRRVVLSERESADIIATRGRLLITDYWGRYVAFLRDPSCKRHWVLRDPIAALPCFGTTFEGVTVYFSSVTDWLRVGVGRLSVNWEYVTQRLTFGRGPADKTALNEVFEVYGGQCIETTPQHRRKEFYWDPASIAASHIIEDAAYARRALHATVNSCIHAWASCYTNILHRLSGGLDSSIVLSCYSSAPTKPSLTAVTYYLPDGNSDERPYARIAAGSVGCRLIEHARDPSRLRFADLLEVAPSVNPVSGQFAFLELSRIERQKANETAAEAISTGDGGDAVFGSHSRLRAPLAYLYRHRIGWPLVRICSQIATHSEYSFGRIFYRTLEDRFTNARRDALARKIFKLNQLLSAPIRTEMAQREFYPHPWFRSGTTMPPDTAALMVWLSIERHFYDPGATNDGSNPEPLEPLASQPIAELSLRTPAWIQNEDGLDRELVRRAFESEVPDKILRRYWKDRAAGFTETAFIANRGFAREFLLDGVLVRERLLDGDLLDHAISGPPDKNTTTFVRLIDCMIVEAWLRTWLQVRTRLAA